MPGGEKEQLKYASLLTLLSQVSASCDVWERLEDRGGSVAIGDIPGKEAAPWPWCWHASSERNPD